MLNDPEFWVAIAFVLFVFAVFKPVGKVLVNALDSHSTKIQQDLEKAQILVAEAQEMLLSYQKRQSQIAEEAQKILDNAESEARRITFEASEKLEESLNKKVQIAMQKISTYENSVAQQIRMNSIEMSMNLVRALIKEKFSTDISEELLSGAINEMSRKLRNSMN